MKNIINISIIQNDIFWEDKVKNFKNYERLFNQIPSSTDIIILPEMFTTGFSMNADKLGEDMNGQSIEWLKTQANLLNSVIVNSLIIKENNNFYNRLVWMQPNGVYYSYDKRHLFRMGKEHSVYTAGVRKTIVQYKGWKFNLQICYDLRFPVWSRNMRQPSQYHYDVLIYVANWPSARKQHWSTLLQARAIENQAYVIGVNRVGIDGNKLKYTGNSTVIDHKGKVLWAAPEAPTLHTVSLDKSKLITYRTNFPAWMDSDNFVLSNPS